MTNCTAKQCSFAIQQACEAGNNPGGERKSEVKEIKRDRASPVKTYRQHHEG
ncbi:hypothetical protein HCG51_33560 [Tolypothrix sp. PCC 7910]|uniref:hypothetical protein n=1 Tax=Tolypothrix sp. PCC 7910 TaxID=2099387 RepID=UPI0014277DAA|nr:hypothetical protein [Tolypothrix sp. PCC 7910]QIR41126.1 hypothetical protein HCG51_33560 [Tolypothrix sp. PCC 7910]